MCSRLVSDMSITPLVSTLTSKPLTGPNYLEWKRTLDYILVAEEYSFVLTTPCPAEPTARSNEVQRDAHKRWIKANNMAKCYIMATMSSELQPQFENLNTAAEIMTSVKELFGEQQRSARFEVMRKLMGTQMAEGSSVREHTLLMFYLLNEFAKLGGQIDKQGQVDIVLNSLPKSYENFRLNVVMSKREFQLNELLNELVAAEGVMGKAPQALATSRSPNVPSKGGKKKRAPEKRNANSNDASGSGGKASRHGTT